MRILFTLFTTISLCCRGQDTSICQIVKEFDSPFQPPTILLFKDNIKIDSTSPHIRGSFNYINLEPGIYKLSLSGRGQVTKNYENIVVEDHQKLQLTIKIQGPCLYDHPVDYVPVCPENHTDRIIPIIYGLFVQAKSEMKDNPESNFISGGCLITGCDPGFYCTVHKIKF